MLIPVRLLIESRLLSVSLLLILS